MIFDGDLEPGSRLTEEDLSRRFGVSRTPLREALKLLTSEGLITIEPNRGATVTALSIDEIAETFPVMGVLEALAGARGRGLAAESSASSVAELLARQKQVVDSAISALDGETVRCLLRVDGRPRLASSVGKATRLAGVCWPSASCGRSSL